MSIKVVSLHKDNKFVKTIEEFDNLNLADMLVSNHDDELHDVTDQFCFRLINLKRLSLTLLQHAKAEGLCNAIRINSGFRTKKINELVKGVKTSQHTKIEAFDLSFYDIDGNLITNKGLKKIAKYLSNFFDAELQQIIVHKDFIHFGMATARKQLKKVRHGF